MSPDPKNPYPLLFAPRAPGDPPLALKELAVETPTTRESPTTCNLDVGFVVATPRLAETKTPPVTCRS